MYLVADANEAFWQVPLHPPERRFYCALLRKPDGSCRYFAFTRTVQASRGGPLSWAQTFALIDRCLFGVLRCNITPNSHRMQVYLDDPIIAFLGTPEVCRHQAALAILTWTVLGIKLAVEKGQYSSEVQWIGAVFTGREGGVAATILASRLSELRDLALDIRSRNYVSVKVLRSFTGKAQSMASLLYIWRPFVHMFYAAIKTCDVGSAPEGYRWVKQIAQPLD